MKNFDADQDYDDFDAWFQEFSSEAWENHSFAWMDTMKKGMTLERDAHDQFKAWCYDNRWPEIRIARECDRLSHLADVARLAA